MRHAAPRRRGARASVAVPVGLALSIALSWSSTYAAFSATSVNAGNSWRSGTVVLTGADSVGALFTTGSDGALKPGSTGSRCLRIDYTGDLTADVRMYVGTPPGGPVSLDDYLVMSVERGADVTAGTTVALDCSTGFSPTPTPTFLYNHAPADSAAADGSRTLAHLKGSRADYASGLVVNAATAPGTHLTLKITYSVKDDNGAQNTQSSATFTWEARNT